MAPKAIKQPQEISVDNPIVYFPGAIDFAAVEEFLRLRDPKFVDERADHIGRLAASLLETRQNASAGNLVRLVTEIDAVAKDAVNKRSDALLEQMNAATVGRLLEDLRNLESARTRVDDREHGPYDAILKTVESRFRKINDNPPRFSAEAIEAALSNADLRMKEGQNRPQAPCDLTTALRYIAGGASTPPAAMESAFIDFLSLQRLEREKKWDSEEEAMLLSRLEECLESQRVVEKNWKLAAGDPVRKFLKDLIKDCRERLTRLEQRKCALHSFVPGSKGKDPVFEEMAKLVESNWKRSDSVSLRTLAWLATDFSPFWEKHKKAYINEYRLSDRARKKAKSTKTSAGAAGLKSRELRRCVKHVRDWLEFADFREKRPLDVVELFADKVYSSKQSSMRLSEFLRAIHDHVVHKTPLKKVVGCLLKKRSIMDEEIVQVCAQKLNQYIQKRKK